MRAWLKKKSVRTTMRVLGSAIGVYSFFSFGHLVRETHVRFVSQDVSAAWAESQKLPPGFGRAEDYLRRLKSIKTGWAPPEMKQALADFIAAYERGLIAMEAGREAPEQSKALANARERLIAIERKYQ